MFAEQISTIINVLCSPRDQSRRQIFTALTSGALRKAKMMLGCDVQHNVAFGGCEAQEGAAGNLKTAKNSETD